MRFPSSEVVRGAVEPPTFRFSGALSPTWAKSRKALAALPTTSTLRRRSHRNPTRGEFLSWRSRLAVVPGCVTRVVGEAEDLLCGFLDGDHEADAVGPPARKWRVRVLERDRIHVPAALVAPQFYHPSLDRGHPVGVGHIGDRQGNAGIAAHVLGLPDRVGGAHEDAVALKPDPHHPVAR